MTFDIKGMIYALIASSVLSGYMAAVAISMIFQSEYKWMILFVVFFTMYLVFIISHTKRIFDEVES